MFRKIHPWNVIWKYTTGQDLQKSAVKRNCTLLVKWYFQACLSLFFFIRNTFLHHALMYGTGILFEKFHWQVPLKYQNNTEAMCEWRLNWGKYVMNGTDWHLVCYSTVFNQYIATVYDAVFSLLDILHKHLVAFPSFSVRQIVKIYWHRHHNDITMVTKT